MFGSRLSGPTVPFMRSIWTYRGGELDLLVQGTLPLPQSVPGDPAPGLPAGYTFSNMFIADFNAASLVAFTGVVTFNMSFEDQTEGIWWENPGGVPGPQPSRARWRRGPGAPRERSTPGRIVS